MMRNAALPLVAVISLILFAIPTLLGFRPEPVIHDEFAYLLQADTFARGRLSNPPSRCWEALETFHVLQQPTYAAKFPPGQGIALAMGQLIWHPILGAWLSLAAGCAAVSWLLAAFVPIRWAVLGGLLCATSPTIYHWSQTYWGGGVALLGGAILAGAAARLARRPTPARGALAGAGIAILANSRPFEGAILTVILAMIVSVELIRRGRFTAMLKRSLPAMLAVLMPTAIWMGYYNWRVTGDPLLLPYAAHARQYMVAPLFYWQSPRPPPQYRHEILRRFYAEDELAEYQRILHSGWLIPGLGQKLRVLSDYLRPGVLILPLLVGVALARRNRAARWAVIGCAGLVLVHFCSTPWLRIQYMAPAVGLFYALIVVGLRWSAVMLRWPGRRAGRAIVLAIVVVHAVLATRWAIWHTWQMRDPIGLARAQFLRELEQIPGKVLVIVRRLPEQPAVAEIVYNSADLDSARVIFARDMGQELNRRTIECYPDRRVVWFP
ncbi:hypothetical protein [Fontivita pretiosa]|uniref:hypothetical protein n=1 Tax=Fontivita pretiosa TaxID=2989684 RepID=UPI003D16970B